MKNKKFAAATISAALVASVVAPIAADAATGSATTKTNIKDVRLYSATKAKVYYSQNGKTVYKDIELNVPVKHLATYAVIPWEGKNIRWNFNERVQLPQQKSYAKYIALAKSAVVAQDVTTAESNLSIAKQHLNNMDPAHFSASTLENYRSSVAEVEKQIEEMKQPAEPEEPTTPEDPTTPATPSVTSVTVANGAQLLVTFSHAVDEKSLSASSFALSDGKTATVELQPDQKTVLLTLSSAYSNATAHTVAVTVQNVKVAGTVDTYFPVFTQVVTVSDQVKAEISQVQAVTNGDTVSQIDVIFSEPVQNGAIYKVNGAAATLKQLSADGMKATLTVSSALKVGETHTVEAINLTDKAGNVNAVAAKTFTVVKDATAPVVTSVEAISDTKLLVTFNKEMKASTVTTLDVRNDALNQVAVDDVKPLADDKSGTKFVVTLNRSAASSLFTSTKQSHQLTVLFAADTMEDYLGNRLESVTRNVLLVKDETKPEITEVSYKKNVQGEVVSIQFHFSEGIAAKSLSFPTELVNENGVLLQSADVFGNISAVSVQEGATSVEFMLPTAKKVSGKYSLSLAAGYVTDTSLALNASNPYATILDFGAETVSGDYTIQAGDVTTTYKGNDTVITVNFPEAVKGGLVAGSATDVSRYTLNGKALPEGTTITLDATQKKATITLPSQSIEKADTAAIFTINGVQTLTGKVNQSFTKTIEVKDNMDPVLLSAKVLDNTTIELTFNEDMVQLSGTANVGDEFKILQGTTALSLADTELVASSIAGYPKKVKLSIAQGANTPGTPATSLSVPTDMADENSNGHTVPTISGTFTGSSDEKLVLVKSSTGWTISGEEQTVLEDKITYKGMTIDVSGCTDVAETDEFSYSLTAAVAPTYATTLDLTKVLTIETVRPSSTVDIKDISGNQMKSGVKIEVVK